MNTQFKKTMVAASIIAASGLVPANEVLANDIESTVDVSFRYRVESVEQDGFTEDANASTLRTRATIKTKWNDSIDTVFEFDDVSEIGMDDYNAGGGTTPDKAQYPVIVDPVGTELNQGYIRYRSEAATWALGRQRTLIGNQRFVGGVGWRQNEQTFDSLSVKSKLGEVDFNYSYVFNVNRIFGETVAAGDNTHNSHLINADYQLGKGKLSAYYFSLDNEDVATFSSNTFGVRYVGNLESFNYTFEVATQSGTADNPNNYDANYYLIEGGYAIDNWSVGAGIEVLGGDSDNGQGFTTSLATLHKFQGWADVFLATPASGIEDTYLNFGYKFNDYNFKAIYHNFSSDEASVDFGSELDLVVSTKLTEHLSGLVKYADFNSDLDITYPSRSKFWLMLTYKL